MAGRLGFCALDKARLPLLGDEVRACWQAPLAADEEAEFGLFATHPGVAPRSAATVTAVVAAPGAEPLDDEERPERRPMHLSSAARRPAPLRERALRRMVAIPVGPGPAAPRTAATPPEGRLIDAPLVRPSRGLAPSTPATRASLERSSLEREFAELPEDRPVG